jgi:hypothetical protein
LQAIHSTGSLAVAHDTVPGCTATPIVATGHKSGSAAADAADGGLHKRKECSQGSGEGGLNEMADSASLSPAKRPRKIDFELNLACLNNEEGFALGEPIPTIPWKFVGSSSYGVFRLCLTSPGFYVDGLPTWRVSKQPPDNQYFQSKQKWEASPDAEFTLEGFHLLSTCEAVTRDFQFAVSLYKIGDRGTQPTKIGNDQYITMRFRGGRAHTIKMLSPINLTLHFYDDEDLPSILLVCYDEWGNRTAPGKDEIWRFTIDENAWVSGVLSQGYRVSSSTGEARLTGLKLTASGRQIPTEGQCVRISVRLVCSKEGAATQNSLTFSIDMKIIPDEVGAFVLY